MANVVRSVREKHVAQIARAVEAGQFRRAALLYRSLPGKRKSTPGSLRGKPDFLISFNHLSQYHSPIEIVKIPSIEDVFYFHESIRKLS